MPEVVVYSKPLKNFDRGLQVRSVFAENAEENKNDGVFTAEAKGSRAACLY